MNHARSYLSLRGLDSVEQLLHLLGQRSSGDSFVKSEGGTDRAHDRSVTR